MNLKFSLLGRLEQFQLIQKNRVVGCPCDILSNHALKANHVSSIKTLYFDTYNVGK